MNFDFATFQCPCCESRRVLCYEERKWRCPDCGLEGQFDDLGRPFILWPFDDNVTGGLR